jgi:hypothetical protein
MRARNGTEFVTDLSYCLGPIRPDRAVRGTLALALCNTGTVCVGGLPPQPLSNISVKYKVEPNIGLV